MRRDYGAAFLFWIIARFRAMPVERVPRISLLSLRRGFVTRQKFDKTKTSNRQNNRLEKAYIFLLVSNTVFSVKF